MMPANIAKALSTHHRKGEKIQFSLLFLMTGFVCVECGEVVSSLYVEYSERNIRLTRCQSCSKVADKYVEYEFILVFIDLILHRKQAYRHLIYNRINDSLLMKSLRWVPTAVMFTNVILKLIVLHTTKYQHISSYAVLHVCVASLLEHFVFMGAVALSLYGAQSTRAQVFSRQNKLRFKIYLYLALPELLKILLIVLQIFDSEVILLVLVGLLVLSVQHKALQSLLSISQRHLALSLLLAAAGRVLIKKVFYSLHDIYLSGVVV